MSVKVSGRVLHQQGEEESTVFQKYGRDENCNYSISRYELNCFLLKECEAAGVRILFGHALKSADFGEETDEKGVKLVFTVAKGGANQRAAKGAAAGGAPAPAGSTTSTIEAKSTSCLAGCVSCVCGGGAGGSPQHEEVIVQLPVGCPVIGADGGPSKVRYALRDAGKIDFSEDLLCQGYREMMFPANEQSYPGYCMDPGGLHIWPRRQHMLMGLADKVTPTFTGRSGRRPKMGETK